MNKLQDANRLKVLQATLLKGLTERDTKAIYEFAVMRSQEIQGEARAQADSSEKHGRTSRDIR